MEATTIQKKMHGTHRTRNWAKKRKAEYLDGDEWLVTGGLKEHRVTAGVYNRPETFKCDCDGWPNAKGGACCHVLCVMEEM